MLLGHSAEVAKLALSPDAALLATCSADCSLRVWDTHTGALRLLTLYQHGSSGRLHAQHQHGNLRFSHVRGALFVEAGLQRMKGRMVLRESAEG